MKQAIEPTKTSVAKRDLIEVLNLLKAGRSLDEGERGVKKLIETLGRDFDVMHVLGEINDRDQWRSAVEMLGVLLLTNHAYRASSHSLLLAQILFDVQVGKKNFQQVMSDSDYRGFIRSAALFHDIATGMASWFEGDLGNAEASFKKAVVLLDAEDTLIEYLEGGIDLIKAEQKFINLFALDDLQLFVEAVLELDYGRLMNDIRDIKKVDNPIAYTLSSVTSVIGSRGSCIAWYVLFLRVIVRILGFLEENGSGRIFQAELTRRLGSIEQNSGVLQVGKAFLVECSGALSLYKSLKDIPRGKQKDLIQILRPIRRFERRHVEKLYDDRESDEVEKQLVGASKSLNPLFELAYKDAPVEREPVKGEKVKCEVWEQKPDVFGAVEHHHVGSEVFVREYLDKLNEFELFVNQTTGQVFFGKEEATEKRSDGKSAPLIRDLPFRILCRFLRKGGIAGDAAQIYNDAWGYDPAAERHFNLVEAQIKILRKKLQGRIQDLQIGFVGGTYRFSRYVKYCLAKEIEQYRRRAGKKRIPSIHRRGSS